MSLVKGWLVRTARQELGSLAERLLGPAGVATVVTTAQLAVLDQHEAAVRDILALGVGQVGLIEIAGYAQGVLDAAVESGWEPSAPGCFDTDWVELRLVAACRLGLVRPAGYDDQLDSLALC